MTEEAAPRVVVLDTSVQIDRRKMPSRQERIERELRELKGCDHTLSTGISLVEFKAVLIQQLITIHNQLRLKKARFTRARDALLEKDHPQVSLRAHIFNNLLGILGNATEKEQDERNAERGRLLLETIIPEIYRWFKEDSANTYLNQTAIKCTRADEPPSKKGRAFDTNLPTCKVGRNRHCRVEDVIRERAPDLLEHLGRLDASDEQNKQLLKARELLQRVIDEPNYRFSVNQCRGCGDALIALEVRGVANEAMSTNVREWERLCKWLGYTLRHITYPDEKTR